MTLHLTVAADVGSSLGKCCYRIEDGPPKDIPGFGSEKSRRGWLAQANAVDEERHRDLAPDSIAIEVKDRCWTIGESAQYVTHETPVRAAKSSTASLRVLGMVGKVLEREDISEANIDLRVLLPVGERRSFQQLEGLLTKALYEVKFNGNKPKLRVNSVRVYPEGAGVAQKVGVVDALVLMFGHKDVSLLPVLKNNIQATNCRTLTGMGMVSLINEFPCFINDELLLAEYLHLEAVGKKGLKRLMGEESLEKGRQNFAQAKARVWRRILQKLSQEPKLNTVSKIYVTGGSMRVWDKELKAKFGGRIAYFKDPLKEMVKVFSDFQKPENKELTPRFTDSYLLMMGGRDA